MKYTISFWTKQDKDLFTIYDQQSNPFKLGMKFWVREEVLFPVTESRLLKKYKEDFVLHILESNKEDSKLMNNKRFKIISEHITLKHDINTIDTERESYSMSVEYFVKHCPKFYWEWWYIKNLFKFRKK